MSDRAIQDQVLRALADAPYRASPEWRERRLADPERVERFARFLARHFYYERVVHFFKYSRALARRTGRHPEAVLTRPPFDALLPDVVLGSREAAAAVATLVVEHVGGGATPAVPYRDDLLAYERAMMVAEAGPRLWRGERDRQDEGAGSGERDLPVLAEGTVLLELSYDLPAVLPALLRPWTEPPQADEGRTQLLVTRSPHGRVAVARSTEAVAQVLALADGTRTLEDLAGAAGVETGVLRDTVTGLFELGAVTFPRGS